MPDPIPTNRSGLRFGVDVGGQFRKWFEEEYLPGFHDSHGDGAEIVVCILDSTQTHDWRNPLGSLAYRLDGSDDVERIEGPEGLSANVAGKLAFHLRTGLPSRVAAHRPDLVEPGDVPLEGAGEYEGYTGGASGLPDGADDWFVFVACVSKLIELRAAAAAKALAASKAREPGMKYLGASPLGPEHRTTGMKVAGTGPHGIEGN